MKKGKAKQFILAIGIAILFVMFIAYAIETIYPSPKYETFCPQTDKQYFNQTACEENNGTWTNYPVAASDKSSPVGIEGYCDLYTTCQRDYNESSEPYNRNIFFITLAIGIITIIVAVLLSMEAVSAGFMAGGVILIIYGTTRYWGSLNNWLRVIMLGFALAVLIWIGYKKLK